MIKSLAEVKPLHLYLLSTAFILLSKFVAEDYLTLSYIFTGIGLAVFILALVKHFKSKQ